MYACKYKKSLIESYINGNDIEGYDIEILENDPQFMMEVIDYSGDAKMYRYCSDEVKRNSDFIIFFITKFKNKVELVYEVIDKFLELQDNDVKRLEVLATFRNLRIPEKNNLTRPYEFIMRKIYTKARLECEFLRVEKPKYKDMSDFLILKFIFGSSKVALDYLAEQYLNEEIDVSSEMNDEEFDLAKIIHDNFRTYEEFEQFGINKFLIELARRYDEDVADYIACNLEVLTNWKGILAHVKNNWDIVNQYNEMQCYELLEQKIDEFLEGYEPNFDIAEVIYKIATELGIVSKMEKYHVYANYIEAAKYYGMGLNIKEWTDHEWYCYETIKRMMIEILKLQNSTFKSVSIDSDDSSFEKTTSTTEKPKTLVFEFKRKKTNPSK